MNPVPRESSSDSSQTMKHGGSVEEDPSNVLFHFLKTGMALGYFLPIECLLLLFYGEIWQRPYSVQSANKGWLHRPCDFIEAVLSLCANTYGSDRMLVFFKGRVPISNLIIVPEGGGCREGNYTYSQQINRHLHAPTPNEISETVNKLFHLGPFTPRPIWT